MQGRSARIGIFWMVGAAACLALGNSLVRMAATDLHPFQIGFLVNILGLILIWPALLERGAPELRGERVKMYAITAVIGGITNLAWYYALASMPLAEATAITFAAPILVTAMAGAVLGERVTAAQWAAVLAGFLGVLIIVRPGIATFDTATAAVLVATVGMASSYLTSKRITRIDSTRRATAVMTAIPVITGLLPALFVWRMPNLDTMLWIAVMAAAMYGGRIAILQAFRNAPASSVMPFDFARLPFVAIIAFAAYGEIPDRYALLGAGIIALAALFAFEIERRREAT